MTNVVSAPVIFAVRIMPARSPSPPQLYAATGPEATNAATEPATASRPLHVLYISGRLLPGCRVMVQGKVVGAAPRRPHLFRTSGGAAALPGDRHMNGEGAASASRRGVIRHRDVAAERQEAVRATILGGDSVGTRQ